MSAQVLSFNTSHDQQLEDYLLLEIDFNKKSDHRFCLSPDVMHWRDDLWIIDMRKSKRYWLAAALGEGVSLESLLFTILEDNQLKLKKWVAANHPWQALFLFEKLKASKRLYHFDEKICQNIAKRTTWAQWLKEAKQLYPLLEKHIKSSKLQRFRSKQAQLLRAMKRLGLEYIYDIEEADSSSMQKRFGYWVGKLWEWTFPNKSSELPLFQSLNSLNEFLWIPEKVKEKAQLQRHLDYSVEQWEHFEEFLREDFESLNKKHYKQKRLSICELEWTLQLYSGKSIALKVSFRNPYPIFSEAPEFTSALNQCRYAFDSWQTDLQEEKAFSDYPEAFKIVSWSIRVTKTLYSSAQALHFNDFTKANDYLKILSLENKLPKAIKQYHHSEGFVLDTYLEKNKEAEALPAQKLWTSSGMHRPLFKYKNPQQIQKLPTKSYFLERNTTSWWDTSNTKNYNQDFFKALQQKQYLWISRNTEGDMQVVGKFD